MIFKATKQRNALSQKKKITLETWEIYITELYQGDKTEDEVNITDKPYIGQNIEVTMEEENKIIKSLKSRKSPGPDRIQNKCYNVVGKHLQWN